VRAPPYAVYSHKVDFTNVAAGEFPCELNHKYAIASSSIRTPDIKGLYRVTGSATP
jgi:hypothetical protein